MDHAATLRRVYDLLNAHDIDILRFAVDGLVHEHWGVFDAKAMMEQLGAGAA